jgi:hypothetical protein
MKNYQDRWTRWHDKPCTDGEPSSNNGWIYSAYAQHLMPTTVKTCEDSFKLLDCYLSCRNSVYPLKIDRSPNDPTPPLSKDEVIGVVSLGLLEPVELKSSHWNFCNFVDYKPEKLTIISIIKAAKLLYAARKEHRNYIWENKVEDAYCLAFWLAPHDQYYVLKQYEKKPSILQTIAFYLNIVSVLTSDNKSTKMMLWLQLADLEHPLVNLVPKDKWVRNYFGEEHPFTKGLK